MRRHRPRQATGLLRDPARQDRPGRRGFLGWLAEACPFKIETILTDNGKEFTYRFTAQGRARADRAPPVRPGLPGHLADPPPYVRRRLGSHPAPLRQCAQPTHPAEGPRPHPSKPSKMACLPPRITKIPGRGLELQMGHLWTFGVWSGRIKCRSKKTHHH